MPSSAKPPEGWAFAHEFHSRRHRTQCRAVHRRHRQGPAPDPQPAGGGRRHHRRFPCRPRSHCRTKRSFQRDEGRARLGRTAFGSERFDRSQRERTGRVASGAGQRGHGRRRRRPDDRPLPASFGRSQRGRCHHPRRARGTRHQHAGLVAHVAAGPIHRTLAGHRRNRGSGRPCCCRHQALRPLRRGNARLHARPGGVLHRSRSSRRVGQCTRSQCHPV